MREKLLLLLLLSYSSAYAQDIEPRAYSNIPVGVNFVLAGYSYSAGGLVFDPSTPLDNAHLSIHGALSAYARSIKLGRMSGKIDIILPYAWLSGYADLQGQTVTREVSGFSDPRVRMTVNFVGAPALSLSEFKDYKQNLVIGASLQVFLPLSQYDPDRLVNIGTNRFTFKPELGISKSFGHLSLEMAGGASFYTVNHNFYQGKTRSQHPIGSVQAHVNYSFKRGMWAAINSVFYWGGRTTVDGVEGNDLQQNFRMGFTFALPLGIRHSLKFHISTGVSTRTGTDFTTAGIVWQFKWGGGLPKAGKSDGNKKKY